MDKFLVIKKYKDGSLKDVQSFKLHYAKRITEDKFEFDKHHVKVSLKINNDGILIEAVENCVLDALFGDIVNLYQVVTEIELFFATDNKIDSYEIMH